MISWIEILLLIVGAGLFVVSFLIPEKEEKVSKETRMMAREEIRDLVSKEMENIRGHVDDVVEESMTYAMEKTERSLERLSNEKIMAVHEYSELVLKEINKNHDEVMFLYDMLNDKHSNRGRGGCHAKACRGAGTGRIQRMGFYCYGWPGADKCSGAG